MADLSVVDDSVVEINGLLDEVNDRLTRLKKAKNANAGKKNDDVAFMRNRMDRAKKALRTMRVEIRELPKVEQKPHNERAQALEDRINQMVLDIDWFEKDQPEGGPPAADLSHHEILNKAKNIQEGDINTIHGVLRNIEETKEIGANTLVKLNDQTNQMINIDKGVDEVSSNLKLASRYMKTFVRRLASDKIFMGFIFLIFVAVVFIIVWSIVKPKSKHTVSVPTPLPA